jgi:CO dehydrogenase maturation factor
VSFLIGVTGKGGVGKTTIAALMVRRLIATGRRPVLGVDADPNSCLDLALGMSVTSSVGAIREEARILAGKGLVAGISKQELMQLKISESLVEGNDFDLISMGRPEGPGCYCYANNVLGAAVRRLAGSYAAVVLDNEAGLENLSRRIVRRADQLLFVADSSLRGLTTARRLYDLAMEMRIEAEAMGLVVNRVREPARGGSPDNCLDPARRIFEDSRVTVVGSLPEDAEVGARDAAGESIWTLPGQNPVWTAAASMFARLAPT